MLHGNKVYLSVFFFFLNNLLGEKVGETHTSTLSGKQTPSGIEKHCPLVELSAYENYSRKRTGELISGCVAKNNN